MEELTYKSISASSNPYSESDKTLETGKLKKTAFWIALICCFLPNAMNEFGVVLSQEFGRGNSSKAPFSVMLIIGICIAIVIYAIVYGFGKSFIEKKESFARQCRIDINEQGINGKMIYHEMRGNAKNPNGMMPIEVREISLIYRQIDNIKLKKSDLIVHAKNNYYSCPNLTNAHEVYEAIQNNLRTYDKGR